LPVPLFPGFDTLGTLEYVMETGYDHTWFVLTQRIIAREFVLSGSDQNPDLTGKNILMLLVHALSGASAQIEGFKRDGIDFVVERNLRDLVEGMNRITDEPLIDLASLQREIEARDREIANSFTKDSQITAIRGSRKYLGDPKAGPLIAVRLNIVTRKTLGGVETDLAGRVIRDNHEPLPGLYAAGEVAGFGGGGVHGYRALEGTFLGGCLFSGRAAGRAVAAAVR
jgi:predicted oxidoreductase